MARWSYKQETRRSRSSLRVSESVRLFAFAVPAMRRFAEPDGRDAPLPACRYACCMRIHFIREGAACRYRTEHAGYHSLGAGASRSFTSFNPQQFVGNCCKACPPRDRLLPEYNREDDFATPCSFSEKVA